MGLAWTVRALPLVVTFVFLSHALTGARAEECGCCCTDNDCPIGVACHLNACSKTSTGEALSCTTSASKCGCCQSSDCVDRLNANATLALETFYCQREGGFCSSCPPCGAGRASADPSNGCCDCSGTSWTGELCTVCAATNSTRESCVHGAFDDDACRCLCSSAGWIGERCEICARDCNMNGVPIPNGDKCNCKCNELWSGEDCGTCSVVCSAGQLINEDSSCHCNCPEDRRGLLCEVKCPIGYNGEVCSGAGECDGDGVCVCDPGKTGDTCELCDSPCQPIDDQANFYRSRCMLDNEACQLQENCVLTPARCDFSGDDGGDPIACLRYLTNATCSTNQDCNWASEQCQGGEWPCGHYEAEETCGNQQLCYWETSCYRVPREPFPPTHPDFASDLTPTSIEVFWGAPTSRWTPITQYELAVTTDLSKEPGSSTTNKITVEGGHTSKYMLTKLTPDTSYYISVRAVNAAGPGKWSAWSDAIRTRPQSSPLAPGKPHFTSTGFHTLRGNWTGPTSDGGTPITGYYVELFNSNQTPTSPENFITSIYCSERSMAGVTGFEVKGLRANQTIYVRVHSVNAHGNGTVSEFSEAVTTDEPVLPGAPSVKQSTPFSASSANITVALPSFDGGTPITGIEIKVLSSGELSHQWQSFKIGQADEVADNTIRVTLRNLEGGKTYNVSVEATNVVGHGQPSTLVTFTMPEPSVPSPPANLDCQIATDALDTIVVTWDPPIETGGRSISVYNMEWRALNSSASIPSETAETFRTQRTLPGLQWMTNYTISVVANNVVGDSEPATCIVDTPPDPRAPAPLRPFYVTGSNDTVLLRWDFDGGESTEIDDIVLVVKDGENANATIRRVFLDHSQREYNVTGLGDGIYYFVTIARNSYGSNDSPTSLPIRACFNHCEGKGLFSHQRGRCDCEEKYKGLCCDECDVGRAGWPDCVPAMTCEQDCYGHGVCDKLTGNCECFSNYTGNCDMCSGNLVNYPTCQEPTPCAYNCSDRGACDFVSGNCTCYPEYAGVGCEKCRDGFVGFPNCTAAQPCNAPNCHDHGTCDLLTGQCHCQHRYSGEDCDQCDAAHVGYPHCAPPKACPSKCSGHGTCNNVTGTCNCEPRFSGEACERCDEGFVGFPLCNASRPCGNNCNGHGTCDGLTGVCNCLRNYSGIACDRCASDRVGYPVCDPPKQCPSNCQGHSHGNCDPVTGTCHCRKEYNGTSCDACSEGYIGYPNCRAPLPCPDDCHHHGSCNALDGSCACSVSYAGDSCDKCADGYANFPECDCAACFCFTGRYCVAPDPVTGIVLKYATAYSLAITWTPPLHNKSSGSTPKATSYDVQVRLVHSLAAGNFSDWSETRNVRASEIAIDELVPDATYIIRVRSRNFVGKSSYLEGGPFQTWGPPRVTVDGPLFANPQDELHLTAGVRGSDELAELMRLKWQWLMFSNDQAIVLTRENSILDGHPWEIRIRSGVMRLDREYTLKVTATDPDSELPGSTDYAVKFNEPPSGGAFQVTPRSGLSLTTEFSFICTGWVDPDEGNVTYQYSYWLDMAQRGSENAFIRLGKRSRNSEKRNVLLPSGSVIVRVEIFDSDGGVTTREFRTDVAPGRSTVSMKDRLHQSLVKVLPEEESSLSLEGALMRLDSGTVSWPDDVASERIDLLSTVVGSYATSVATFPGISKDDMVESLMVSIAVTTAHTDFGPESAEDLKSLASSSTEIVRTKDSMTPTMLATDLAVMNRIVDALDYIQDGRDISELVSLLMIHLSHTVTVSIEGESSQTVSDETQRDPTSSHDDEQTWVDKPFWQNDDTEADGGGGFTPLPFSGADSSRDSSSSSTGTAQDKNEIQIRGRMIETLPFGTSTSFDDQILTIIRSLSRELALKLESGERSSFRSANIKGTVLKTEKIMLDNSAFEGPAAVSGTFSSTSFPSDFVALNPRILRAREEVTLEQLVFEQNLYGLPLQGNRLGTAVHEVTLYDGIIPLGDLQVVEPISITIPLHYMHDPVNTAECAYWDELLQDWIVDKQQVYIDQERTRGDSVVCSSHRFGAFAVVMPSLAEQETTETRWWDMTVDFGSFSLKAKELVAIITVIVVIFSCVVCFAVKGKRKDKYDIDFQTELKPVGKYSNYKVR